MLPTKQIRAGALDYLETLAVWVLVGLPVGGATTNALLTFDVSVPLTVLELPLVIGALVVATLELLDRRPRLGASLGFFATAAFSQIPALILAFLLPDPAVVDVLADLAPLTVGYLVAFHWGWSGTARRVEHLLDRLVKRPGSHRPREQ